MSICFSSEIIAEITSMEIHPKSNRHGLIYFRVLEDDQYDYLKPDFYEIVDIYLFNSFRNRYKVGDSVQATYLVNDEGNPDGFYYADIERLRK